jgi:hypothetical protein
VKATQRALETRNPALALIWVQEKGEREIRKASHGGLFACFW